jgi:cysteine synthase
MPENVSIERKRTLIALGAKIVLSDASKGMNGAEDLANEIVKKDPKKYFMPNQFANKYNVLAHYETTAEEIWKDTNGTITHFIAGIGTSGTLMGVSKKLKERNPKVKVIAVEPDPSTPIPGLKNLKVNYVPRIWDPSLVDEIVSVKISDAEETARLLALREGIFCGPSTGAILHVALEKIKDLSEGVLVAMAPDGGEKYISTELCDLKSCIECAKKYGVHCAYVEEA